MRHISKDELHEMDKGADSVTSLRSGFGTYDAIVWTGGKVFRVTTASLDPTDDVEVKEIDDTVANKLMAA